MLKRNLFLETSPNTAHSTLSEMVPMVKMSDFITEVRDTFMNFLPAETTTTRERMQAMKRFDEVTGLLGLLGNPLLP